MRERLLSLSDELRVPTEECRAAEKGGIMVKTILEIDGMMCGMCESHINDTIRNNFQVKKASSSHSKGKAEIISEKSLDKEKLKQAIDASGYILKNISEEPYEKKKFLFF